MKLYQLYRYLYLPKELSSEEQTKLPDFFKGLKEKEAFRAILKALNNKEVEKALYNNTDYEWLINFVDFIKYKYTFENLKYQYFGEDRQIETLFQTVFYLCQIKGYAEDCYHSPERYTYQLLVYFNVDNNIETLLKRFDEFCERNHLEEKKFFEFFPRILQGNSTVQLSAWQKVIAQEGSENSLKQFNLAREYEKYLGRPPVSITELPSELELLAKKTDWDCSALIRIFTQCEENQFQLEFIRSLTSENIKTLGENRLDFCSFCASITNHIAQAEFLQKINKKLIEEIAQSYNDYSKLIQAVSIENIPYLMEELIGSSIFKAINTPSQLIYFLKNTLPESYDKTDFLMKVLSKERIKTFTKKELILELMSLIPENKRICFLFKMLAEEVLVPILKDSLQDILMQLPAKHGLNVVIKVHELDKDIFANKKCFSEIKKQFSNPEDKDFFNGLYYSQADLAAKPRLKKIKQTIRDTKWSFSWLEQKKGMVLGKSLVEVPAPVERQIEEFWALQAGEKSPAVVLEKISQIGKEEAHKSQSWPNSFFAANETQKYYAKFENEEAFSKAFK